MNMSSRLQRYAIIAGAISLPAVIFFIFFVKDGQNAHYQDKELLVHERTVRLAKDLGLLLSSRLSALDHIGFTYNELSRADISIKNQFIQDFAASRKDIADIAVVDHRGREVAHKTVDTKKLYALIDRSQNIEFLVVKEKGYYLGPVYLSQGKPVFLMGRAIQSADGKIMRGAIFVLFHADDFLDVLKEAAVQDGVMAFIVNERGAIVLHPTLSYINEQKDVSYKPSVRLAMVSDGFFTRVYKNDLTEKTVGSAAPLMITSDMRTQLETGWFVIMETPASIVFAALASQRSFVGIGLFMLCILAGAGLWIILRVMHRPVLAIDHALKEISNGNFSYRLDIPDSDEWKHVSTGINNVSYQLARASHNLIEERVMVVMERNKLTLALSEIFDAVIACDGDGNIILANKPAEELIGCSADAMSGKHIDETVRLFENNTSVLASAYYSQAEANGLVRMGNTDKLRLMMPENHERLVSVRMGAFGMKESTHHGYMIALHDVSRERFLEKVKADFVFIAAHELRTPLTEVKWAMDILMGKKCGVLSRKQKNLIKRSFDSNEHMIQLVDDLLETATIESAQFHYNKATADIKKIVSDIIQMRQKIAKSKGITLVFKKPNMRTSLVSVDQAAIKIAVDNLLKNAIAYTPKGGRVDVSIGRTDSALEIYVTDTGIGISHEDTDRIFLKFFRGKDAIKMITDGAGLGLYVAKRIIEAHGGTIWVQSQPDKGSTFGVSLPV